MIKPHGSTQLNSLYIEDATERAAQLKRAETLPSLLLNSAA
ncbi:MAG TPA: sulfate adenylyltransferase, partial [Halieaceae bacterium]|nr:sulfate adenylyltransferase [Halieaceae bacterium]